MLLLLTLLNHKTVVLASTVSHIAQFNLRLSLDKYISRHTDVFVVFFFCYFLYKTGFEISCKCSPMYEILKHFFFSFWKKK